MNGELIAKSRQSLGTESVATHMKKYLWKNLTKIKRGLMITCRSPTPQKQRNKDKYYYTSLAQSHSQFEVISGGRICDEFPLAF